MLSSPGVLAGVDGIRIESVAGAGDRVGERDVADASLAPLRGQHGAVGLLERRAGRQAHIDVELTLRHLRDELGAEARQDQQRS